jgi:ABC-2 type transport system permease protein
VLFRSEVALTGLGLILAAALFAMLGVGVGAVVRNQAAALVGVIVWLQIVELSLLTGLAPALFGWTATGAAYALARVEPPSRLLVVLPPVQGALLLTAYGLIAALIAAAVTVRRDVT